jgi:hypothetical protein
MALGLFLLWLDRQMLWLCVFIFYGDEGQREINSGMADPAFTEWKMKNGFEKNGKKKAEH